MKSEVLKRIKKMCVVAGVVSMLATFAACGAAEEQASNAVATEVASTSTEVTVATEAPTSESTEESTAQSTMEPIDVSKLPKKITYYGNASGSYYVETIYTYNEVGLLVKEEVKDSSLVEEGIEEPDIVEYTYDAYGNLIQQVRQYNCPMGGGMFIEQTETTSYNTDGNEIKFELKDDSSNQIMIVREYTYDESGYLVEQYEVIDGAMERRTCYENDSYGNVLKTYTVDAAGNRTEAYDYKQYEYYADGTLKREERYITETGKLKDVTEYDEQGRFCLSEYLDDDGTCSIRECVEYDEQGDVTKRLRYEKINNPELVLVREAIYSKEDNTVTTTSYDYAGENGRTSTEMLNCEFPEYDENGRLVSKKVNSSSTPEYYYLYDYEYDEAGNMIKETCYSYYFEDNGSVSSWTEYVY